jgi:hypothetical protein
MERARDRLRYKGGKGGLTCGRVAIGAEFAGELVRIALENFDFVTGAKKAPKVVLLFRVPPTAPVNRVRARLSFRRFTEL